MFLRLYAEKFKIYAYFTFMGVSFKSSNINPDNRNTNVQEHIIRRNVYSQLVQCIAADGKRCRTGNQKRKIKEAECF